MILVSGGAGYIGSHTVRLLKEEGVEAAVLDNLSTGHRASVEGVPLYEGDLGDRSFVRSVFEDHPFEAVIHFAASCYVGESVVRPEMYYRNNVVNTLNLLDETLRNGVNYFVFSSTAATYGNPKEIPMPEEHPQNPINPYGMGKLFIENVLKSYQRAHSLNFTALRYFNASGAHPSGEIGEDHDPETHLIPLVLRRSLGKVENLEVYGSDYDTNDGTCIRDYIHVCDLAQAHILALKYLKEGGESTCFNIGNGKGYSVLEVIKTAEKVIGKSIDFSWAPRREGDPPSLVASSDKIMTVLGWNPRYPDLKTIMETAWKWHSTHEDGYKK